MKVDRNALAARRAEAVELRASGMPYRRIAARLSISVAVAYNDVARAIEETTAEDVGLLRRIEGQRLDAAQAAIWPKVEAGNLAAIDSFVRLSARRARLFGLDDAPELQVSIEVRHAYQARMSELMDDIGHFLASPVILGERP